MDHGTEASLASGQKMGVPPLGGGNSGGRIRGG